ncbi:hypothetical protein HK104_008366 [Borealophlyctis nickersoniae]|nr:hypothetical protein HK104_008366 [Borealophlyctis nickersoniae]
MGLAHTYAYGKSPIIKAGRDAILIFDPAIAREVLVGQDYHKARIYEGLKPTPVHTVFSTQDKDVHRGMRRFLSPAFSIKYINGLEPLMHSCLHPLLARIGATVDQAPSGIAEIDIWKLMHKTALDVIGETAFGGSFGMVSGHEHRIPKAIQNQLTYLASTGYVSWFRKLSFVPYNKRNQDDHAFIESFMKIVITERRAQAKRVEEGEKVEMRHDLLHLLVTGKDPETGEMLADHEVISNAVLFLIAGSDTSSNTMGFAFIYLMHNPAARLRLQKELDALPIDPASGLILHSALKDCAYLDACIKETMRIHPVGINLPRQPREGDIVLGGRYLIPKDTLMIVANQAIQLDPHNWEDPEKFLPERWLEKGGADAFETFFPFSAGSRNCIGKNFAWMEMRLVIGNLLRKFNLEPIQGLTQSLETSHYITLRLKTDSYLVKASRR